MMIRKQIYIAAVAAIFCASGIAVPVRSQDKLSADAVREELKSSGGFTDEDLGRLERGEIVIRELTRSVKREVALIGAVKLPYSFELSVRGFRQTLSSQKRTTSKQSGAFSSPAQSSDLNKLDFEEGELADLRECRIGNCEWNLPADIIDALRRDVDWESPGANESAQELLKKALAAYVRRYSEGGDAELMSYRDTNLHIGLREEYAELLSNLFWIDGREPAFAAYVRGFPKDRPEGAESDISWSEVKIGLKPVVMFTHSMSLKTGGGESGRMLSVSKQIFANHYFDSSMSVIILAGIPGGDGDSESYLVFVSRSRASALRGKLAGLLRGLIEDQAKGKLGSFLEGTRKYTALASANVDAAVERKASLEEEAVFTLRNIFYVAVPVIAILLGVVIFLLMRKRAG